MTPSPAFELERAAALLSSSNDYRVLRRVRFDDGVVILSDKPPAGMGAAVDVETTGLDLDRDRIIELAIRRFRYDDVGRILRLDKIRRWTEDPLVPIPPEVTRITGLRIEDVAGTSIDETAATRLLCSCDIVISHNAAFDRPLVEDRLPDACGLAWGCSVADLDWSVLGFEGRQLGWLLTQCGRFYEAHRAGNDVDALIELLRHELPEGHPVLSALLRGARRKGWLVRACGAHFDMRHALKERGYRWSAAQRVWLREVDDAHLDAERAWLAETIYAPRARPRESRPLIDPITCHSRHGRLH